MPFIPFMRPENLTLKELLQPLSARTMPSASGWGIGGLRKDWMRAVVAQRKEVEMSFQRTKKYKK